MKIEVSSKKHWRFAEEIKSEMADSAQKRGTGIAQRSLEFLREKMLEGRAVIALEDDDTWAGFCYLSLWSNGDYVANSGMIVSPKHRKKGVAKLMKDKIFQLSRELYPNAKIFSLTTGLAVMKINSDLGYKPVTYSEITKDTQFWDACKSCINYDVLRSKNKENCLCTAMLYDAEKANSVLNNKLNNGDEKEYCISL